MDASGHTCVGSDFRTQTVMRSAVLPQILQSIVFKYDVWEVWYTAICKELRIEPLCPENISVMLSSRTSWTEVLKLLKIMAAREVKERMRQGQNARVRDDYKFEEHEYRSMEQMEDAQTGML